MAKATDWAWLAGMLDGEGCIVINRHHARHRADLRTDSFRLFVQISLCDRPALERCVATAGVGTIQNGSTKTRRTNRTWVWMVAAREAVQLLRRVMRYLTIKRAEAELALEFSAIKPWLYHHPEGPNSQKPAELVDQLATLYWRIRMCKTRWRFYRQLLSSAERREIKRLNIEDPCRRMPH